MITRKEFYEFINEGLCEKFIKQAGPVQTINITYENKQDIHMLEENNYFDNIEIEFIGNFIEEKLIHSDLLQPKHIRTHIDNVKGTLFIKNDLFDDLIIEV